jgi:hypothetical protein
MPEDVVDPDVDPPLGTVTVDAPELATLAQTWFDGPETPAELKARTR